MASVDGLDTYKALTDCMVRGAHVELKLRGGETVARFRVHDIIAPNDLQTRPDMSEALVRGIVWPDHAEQRDRVVKLRDIEAVRDERLALPYFATTRFFQRNPSPDGWLRLEICRSGPHGSVTSPAKLR